MHIHALRLMSCAHHVAHLVADPAPMTAWVAIASFAPDQSGERTLRFIPGTAGFGWDMSKVTPGDPLEYGIRGGVGRAYAVFVKRPNLVVVCDSAIAALQLSGALRARDAATLAALGPYVKGAASGTIPAFDLPPLFAVETSESDTSAIVRGVVENKARADRAATDFVLPPAPPSAVVIPPPAATNPTEWPEPVPLLKEAPQTPLGGYIGCITRQQAAAARVKATKAGLSEDTLHRLCRTYLGVPELEQVRRFAFGRLMDELIPAHASPDNQLGTYRLSTQDQRDAASINRVAAAWRRT